MKKASETKLLELMALAKQPVGQIEAKLAAECGLTKGKVALAVEKGIPDLHEAAVHAKASAVWQAMELINQVYLTDLKSEAVQALFLTYPHQTVSAMDVFEVINGFSHQAHSAVLQTGWHFTEVCNTFDCNPEVKAELYQVVLPHGTEDSLVAVMEEVAQKTAGKAFPNTPAFVEFLLGKFATFYAAKHVVQAYETAAVKMGEAN